MFSQTNQNFFERQYKIGYGPDTSRACLGNSKYARTIGLSKAIRVGNFIYVAGCNALNEKGEIIPSVDSYEQTKKSIQNVEMVLKELGASLGDVVRTRVYVGPSTKWRAVGKAYGEFLEK